MGVFIRINTVSSKLLNLGNYCSDIIVYIFVTLCLPCFAGGHSSAVVTHSPPTSKVGGSNPGPYVGKLVVSLPLVGSLQNLDTNCMYWFPPPIKNYLL